MLTAWANFQGPFTLHSVAAGALGPQRLEAAADHAAELGRQLRDQGDGLRLRRPDRARRRASSACPCAGRRIGSSTSPAARPSTARITDLEAAFTSDGELLALRYDVLEDVGAYIRAPEPASLYRMHGALTGAYRVQHVAVRNRVVLTNRCPTGLNRGFGGPQLYMALERTMAIAARQARARPGRARAAQPDRRRTSFPTARRRAGSTTRATTRAASRTRSSSSTLRRAAGGAARGARRRAPVRDRRRLLRRAVDLEHGLRHARADGRGARGRPAQVGKRGGRDCRDLAARRHHRADRDDAAGAGARDRRRAGRRRGARRHARGDRGADGGGHVDERVDGLLRELLVAVLGRRRRGRPSRRAEARGEDRGDPRARGRRVDVAAPRRRHRALAHRGAAAGDGAWPARDRVLRRAEPRRRRTRTTASPPRPPTASSPTSRSSRSTARRGR